jgi:hypothetical protein
MPVVTSTHPSLIDVWQLAKGDYISPEFLEGLTGFLRYTQDYSFAMLSLRDDLERRLGAIGNPVTIKQEDQGLRLLTDSEAAEYNAHRGNKLLGQMGRAHKRNQAVDSNNLSQEEDHQHLRNLQVQGTILSSAKQIKRQYRMKSFQRRTPGLPVAVQA